MSKTTTLVLFLFLVLTVTPGVVTAGENVGSGVSDGPDPVGVNCFTVTQPDGTTRKVCSVSEEPTSAITEDPSPVGDVLRIYPPPVEVSVGEDEVLRISPPPLIFSVVPQEPVGPFPDDPVGAGHGCTDSIQDCRETVRRACEYHGGETSKPKRQARLSMCDYNRDGYYVPCCTGDCSDGTVIECGR